MHLFTQFLLVATVDALHHMNRKIPIRRDSSTNTPLVISSNCADTVYPGIVTQGGTGPATQGFELQPGQNKSQTVSSDWQGRVWARTNCSFNDQGTAQGGGAACLTGDCGGTVNCQATGQTPVSLAEFTLDGGDGKTYYDISIVDGYNVDIAIILIPGAGVSPPPNQSNPSCIGSVGGLASANFNPYSSGSQTFLGTTAADPLPFDTRVTYSEVADWCPWDLQKTPPTAPGDGVYPYPDTNIPRPAFDPCYSACAKYNKDSYCCTGSYNSPNVCKPNYYSEPAKKICPDAYSFAYDDQTSTFTCTKGPGFEVVFCPGGRSTTIKASEAGQSTSSGASSSSSGSLRLAIGRQYPILDPLTGPGGVAVLLSLLTTLFAACVF